MAKLVVGNEAIFDMVTMSSGEGQYSQSFVDNIANHYHQAFGNVQSAVTDAIQVFQDKWVQTDAGRIVQAMMHKVSSIFTQNTWQPLNEDWKVQHAPNPMLRGIMAVPQIRRLARKNMCAAFGERYVDIARDMDPDTHRDRLYARNGLFNIPDELEDDEPEWSYTLYDDNFVEDDPYADLTIDQMRLLEDAEHRALAMIAADVDPTDEANGSLGRS